MANIREVANRAGVSMATVSKVLNRPERVSEPTRRRVQVVIDELGFVRNASARQLRAGHNSLIGLIVLDITNPFFTDLARGAEDVARAAGSVVILGNSDDSLQQESHYLRVLEEQRVQGLLIAPVQDDVTYLQRLKEHGIALVVLGPIHAGICSVSVDDVHGGELAAAHLFATGHERIAFVHGPLSIRAIADRQKGAWRAAETQGYDRQRAIVNIAVTAQGVVEGEACVPQLLAATPRPTAVFCANDLLAIGVMRGLLRHGIMIPADMALVGFDDIAFADLLTPSLTTIRQPRYEVGRTATELLFDEINRPTLHRHKQIVFQPELVIRGSSRPSDTGEEREIPTKTFTRL